MNQLPVHAHGLIDAVGVVTDPPLVMIGVAFHAAPAKVGKGRFVSTAANVVDNRLGNDLVTVPAPAAAQHLGKACQITQGRVQTGASPLGSCRVEQHKCVLLGAELAPDSLADKSGDILSAGTTNQPAQYLGMHGAIGEVAAVFARCANAGQVVVQAGGPGPLWRLGNARRQPVMNNVGGAVGVDLGVVDISGHIQHLLHARAAPARICQLGNNVGDLGLGIQRALRYQQRRNQPGKRLADRPQHMRA